MSILFTEKHFDQLADGGSPRSRSAWSPHPSRSNIAGVVQSEIQNVLLAQQVSLLSQILLGQTMIGSGQGVAQMSTVADVLNNLQGLRFQAPVGASSQTTADGKKNKNEPDEDKENTRPPPDETLTVEHLAPTQSPLRGRKFAKKQNKFSIPLLHVPGISKSHDPKIPDLIKTPESKQAWTASSLSKGKIPIQNRSSPTKLLRPEHVSNKQALSHRPICQQSSKPAQDACLVSNKPSHQTPIHPITTPQGQVPPSPTPANNRNFQPPYKTAFPILNKPVEAFVPVKPIFRQETAQHRPHDKIFSSTSFSQQLPTAPRVPTSYPAAPRPFHATLIDPREVIGYHARKQAFTSVRVTLIFFFLLILLLYLTCNTVTCCSLNLLLNRLSPFPCFSFPVQSPLCKKMMTSKKKLKKRNLRLLRRRNRKK